MQNEYLILIGALGGASIGALSTIITTWITKYYENKNAYRSLLIETGMKNWEAARESSLKVGGDLYPLDCYLIHQAKIVALILEGKTSKEDLEKVLNESLDMQKTFLTHSEKIKTTHNSA